AEPGRSRLHDPRAGRRPELVRVAHDQLRARRHARGDLPPRDDARAPEATTDRARARDLLHAFWLARLHILPRSVLDRRGEEHGGVRGARAHAPRLVDPRHDGDRSPPRVRHARRAYRGRLMMDPIPTLARAQAAIARAAGALVGGGG